MNAYLKKLMDNGGGAILAEAAELERRVKGNGDPCCGCHCLACPFNFHGVLDAAAREADRRRQRDYINGLS